MPAALESLEHGIADPNCLCKVLLAILQRPLQEHPELSEARVHLGMLSAAKAVLQVIISLGAAGLPADWPAVAHALPARTGRLPFTWRAPALALMHITPPAPCHTSPSGPEQAPDPAHPADRPATGC